MRLEAGVLGFCLAAWTLAVARLGWGGGDAVFEIGLYGLYAWAAILGWLAGNVYVARRRRLERCVGHLLTAVYSLGPPGLVVLAWALGPSSARVAAPLAALWGLGVYAVFFGVPLTLGRR